MPTENGTSENTDQVVVTIDQQGYLAPTLELGIALAVINRCSLHGLFIEDTDLLRVASLPFAREVSLLSAQPRALDYQSMLSSFNAIGRQFRQTLEQHAKQSSLNWSYRSVRGNRHQTALQESTTASFLIMGHPKNARRLTSATRRIVLINHGGQRLLQALDAVLEKFQQYSVELVLVSRRSPADDNTLALLDAKLRSLGNVSIRELKSDQPIANPSPRGEVVDYLIGSRDDYDLIEQWIQVINCTAIVVS